MGRYGGNKHRGLRNMKYFRNGSVHFTSEDIIGIVEEKDEPHELYVPSFEEDSERYSS
jgi:hypothetical protein